MSLTNHRVSEARLLAELTARPSVALCMVCLLAATGLSIADAGGDLERHGMRVDAWDARCDRCHRSAVIVAIANPVDEVDDELKLAPAGPSEVGRDVRKTVGELAQSRRR